jgi:Brp/Blh family beta-carotene 15,15'-monooxygenase
MNSLGWISSSVELNGIGIVLIILLGIPHGALDNEIAKRANGYSAFRFYMTYLGVMALFLCAWLIWPLASLVLFLFSSAYHFGQSQFSDLEKISPSSKAFLYMSWGVLLLSCLILFRWSELEPLIQANLDTQALQGVLDPTFLLPISMLSAILLLFTLAQLVIKREMTLSRLAKELLIFGLLVYAFYLFPLVLAFALYFCILHSLRVLDEEYRTLSLQGVFGSIKDFFRCLAPLTVISYVGLGLLYWARLADVLPLSDLKMVFIMTSLITLPHCFVMEFFYSLRSSNSDSKAKSSIPSKVSSTEGLTS